MTFSPARTLVLPLLLIALGLVLRAWNVWHEPMLWLDEVFSAKLAQSPLGDLLLAVPRFDTHPPLYYVQLHVWALLGQSDRWLILNSTLLDLAVIASLWWTVGRIHGRAAGVWVAGIYAVMPLAVFFAENVRMYALLFLQITWLWYLIERRVQGEVSRGRRWGQLLLGIAASLTHGLGFFAVFFIYLQGLVRIWIAGRRIPWAFVVEYLPVASMAVWSLGIGSFRQTEGLVAFSIPAVGQHLTLSLLGFEAPYPELLGYLALFLLVLPLAAPDSRRVVLWLVLLPAAVLLVLSLGVKNVFMYRTLGLFTPFAAVAIGLFLTTGRRSIARPVVAAVLAVAAFNSTARSEKQGYQAIAAAWEAEAAPDAVLFTLTIVDLWGFTRYLNGAPEFSALVVQPPVREGLLRLKERLQGTFLERAGLFGQTDHFTVMGRELWSWPSSERLADLETYWAQTAPDSTCLRPGDRVLQTIEAQGHTLVQCGP